MKDLKYEITEAQVFIERVETILAEVTEEYFNDLSNFNFNPGTPEGKENIASYFNQNRILTDIAYDYAIQVRKTLAGLMGIIKNADREGERLEPIGRLERLGIAAARNGKGREWVAALEKHGLERYADFPLSKYCALEADLMDLGKKVTHL
jgi:hypothetical protein